MTNQLERSRHVLAPRKFRVARGRLIALAALAAAMVGRQAAATPFAYTPGGAIIDTATDTVVGSVSGVGNVLGGVAMNPAGTRVYMLAQSAGLRVVNTATNSVIATVSAASQFSQVAVHPSGTRVYATQGNSDLLVIDGATNTVLTTVVMGASGSIGGIAVHPDGSRVYVGRNTGLSVIDTATNTVVTTVAQPAFFTQAGAVAVNPSGTRVYASFYNNFGGQPRISIIDTATNTEVGSIPLVWGAGLAINPAGTRMYAAGADFGLGFFGVRVIDLATHMVLTSISLDQPAAVAVNPAGTKVYVIQRNSSGTAVIDAATNTVTTTVVSYNNPGTGVGLFIGPYCPSGGCSDSNPCTDDACNPLNGACSYTNNSASCDDGTFCNGPDTCSGGACVLNGGDPCTGGTECADSCDEALDNCFDPAMTACTSDGNVCTDDHCDGAGACIHPNNSVSCDDGQFCNGADTCSGGVCNLHAGDPCTGGPECVATCNEAADDCFDLAGTPCTDDGNVCTDDECDGAGGCTHPNNGASCDDGQFCNGTDTCAGGACVINAGDPCVGGPECADACNEAVDNCFDPSGTACTADGNVCTDDECNGAGACAHPNNTDPCDDGLFCNGADTCSGGSCLTHAGDPCPGPDGDGDCAESCDEAGDACTLPDPNGGSCTDGDPCTVGETCTAGSCGGGTLDPAGCIDHYLCYKAKETSGTPKFVAVPGVSLVDQFDSVTAEVRKPKAICPPADKNGEGVLDEDTHALSYQVKATPAHLPQTDIEVTDQFGTLRVDTVKLDRLFVPTTKGLGSPPVPPAAGVADHYTCYKVKVTPGTPKFPKGVQASVVDQFQTRVYDVGKPRRLCVPVDKNGEGLVNEAAHLMCYKVKPASGEPKHTRVLGQIHTENQFGALRLDTVKEEVLCVPAEKIP
jgi:YVTN family beta-propeller protein